ncbi:MAG TPA: tetratricopeptide repeat protein [Gemmataceae bacterium]|jgi:tetratricopeptide (TPR) repeat protein|nr:tetratricopeptide repeat protein [Gemmataceae bacterium]
MSTLGQTLSLAVRYHQAGDLQQAEQLYHQILQEEPYHVDALHLLGLVAVRQGNPALACDYIRRALRSKPDFAEAHSNLGNILLEMGQLDQAIQCYQHAIRLKPRFADAHSNLGNALRQQGKLDEALASLQQCLRVKSDFADAHNHMGSVLRDQGKLEDAVTRYKMAVRLKPDHVAAHSNLGNALREQGKLEEAAASLEEALRLQPNFVDALSHLGNVRRDQGRLNDAVALYQEALRINPDFAEAHNNLGVVLREQGNMEEAVWRYRQALRLKPNFAAAQSNLAAALLQRGETAEAVGMLEQVIGRAPSFPDAYRELGNALAEQDRLDEAVASFQQALRLQPHHAEAQNNLGVALGKQGKLTEAVATFREALRSYPDNSELHYNLGTHLLLLGDFEQGWAEYEWRWRTKEVAPRPFMQPLWDGAALNGKTILLHAEQGLGDTLHFIRYAPRVKECGGTVVAEVQPVLMHLLARSPGVDQLVAAGSRLPPFDVHAPLLSLPAIFRTTAATVPADVPYVFADPSLEQKWHEELSAGQGFKIGISWQGNPKHKRDRQRSFALAELAPVARIPGLKLLSLQLGKGHEQLAALGGRFAVTDLGSRFDPASFADAAAVLKNLDLVITVDTALAHLAGALGVPVWVALSFVPDWRWLLSREDSPWYPTARLLRQTTPGDWGAVFARMAAELAQRAPK